MLWTVFTVAFYGFFGASELLQTKWFDIALFPTQMSFDYISLKLIHFKEAQLFKYFQLAHLQHYQGNDPLLKTCQE